MKLFQKAIINYPFSLVLILVAAYIISLSSSAGRANSSDAGSTGAPCDNSVTCGNALCHSDNSFGMTTEEFDLIDPETTQLVTEYTPGKLYNVQVRVISGPGTGRFGFQATVLDSDHNNVGTWLNPGTNIQIAQAPDCNSSPRTYVEHESPHLFSTFVMDWMAPDCDVGTVTFYYAGNKVNNNGSNTGDSGGLGDSSKYDAVNIDHLLLDQTPIASSYYWAKHSISLSGTVESPDTVSLRTRDSIIFLSPFEMMNGALLEANMSDCN